VVNPPSRQSAYADFLYQKIEQYFLQKGSAFTLKELSEFSGLKVTSNFRRRVNHCVAVGTLAVRPAQGWSKGSFNVFYRPTQETGDIPF